MTEKTFLLTVPGDPSQVFGATQNWVATRILRTADLK